MSPNRKKKNLFWLNYLPNKTREREREREFIKLLAFPLYRRRVSCSAALKAVYYLVVYNVHNVYGPNDFGSAPQTLDPAAIRQSSCSPLNFWQFLLDAGLLFRNE